MSVFQSVGGSVWTDPSVNVSGPLPLTMQLGKKQSQEIPVRGQPSSTYASEGGEGPNGKAD